MGSKLKYNFQSVGDPKELLEKIKKRREAQSEQGTPVGIKTPLKLSEKQRDLLEMNVDQLSAIKDNMRNLILTNHGERLAHYDFGANLISVVNELGSEDGDSTAMALISKAVGKFMPFVSLQGFDTRSEPVEGNPVTVITITYYVPPLDPNLQNLQGLEVAISFDG